MGGDAGEGEMGSEGDGASGDNLPGCSESFCLLTNSLRNLIVANLAVGTLFNQFIS